MTIEREHLPTVEHAARRGIRIIADDSQEGLAQLAEWTAQNAQQAAAREARKTELAAAEEARKAATSTAIRAQNARQAGRFPAVVTGVVQYRAGQYGVPAPKALRPTGFCAPYGLSAADKGRTITVRLIDAWTEERVA